MATPHDIDVPAENVVAIDFGTTYSSLAYSIKRGSKTETLPIDPHQKRVPTALLLKNEGGSISVVGFGFQAQAKYVDLSPQQYANHLYFECFKMQLRNEEEISREMTISTSSSTRYYLVEIIALVLQHLKTKFEEHLQVSVTVHGLNTTDDFAWIVTVPAIWKNRGKQMMREAAYRAGLLSNDVPPITTLTPVDQPLKKPDMRHCAHKLTLALEPECAALYCLQMTNDQVAGYCKSVINVTSECYMVADVGGGTVDIAVHKVDSNGTISSVLPPKGNEWGGNKINDKFANLIQDIVKDPQFERFRTEPNREARNKAIISDFIYQYFERKKKEIGDTADDLTGSVNIRLNSRLVQFYKEECIAAGVQALGDDRVQFHNDDVLEIHYSKMICDLFAPAVKKIIDCIITSLATVGKTWPIDTIYLVGGFGGCQYLYRKLNKALMQNYSQVRVIVPSNHTLAVVEGALSYGFNLGVVESRISDAHYGLQVIEDFDPSKHELCRKKYNNELKRYKCYDVFQIFIEKGKVLLYNDTFTNSYTPHSASQEETLLKIYRTLADNVKYTKDSGGNPVPGVEQIGTLLIETPACDLPREKRDIKCTLHLGGTELKVTALYVPTGKEVHAALDFL